VTFGPAIAEVEQYYARKLDRHGPTPRGVDWNDDGSQRLRFEQLLALVGDAKAFSLNDYGCGYGALLDHLLREGREVRYTGYDISPAMIATARERHEGAPRASFTTEPAELRPADFTVASGVFNVKLDTAEDEWRQYVFEMIDQMAGLSVTGMAFNALTSHTDPGRRRPDLYYADPAAMLDHCLRAYSRDVALRHDYALYEFTILVRLAGRPPAQRAAAP
jgi:SAM-dependent methyltransferase